ncbi:MAG TPA: type II toxin-antitoxin system Phd/YefM family antitoxin [Candidatus Binatia bacterium]|nr:type II toxin-antitoxin system Phd/YefM family antitoxin [Candidatus Binatia bacterium]
MRLKPTEDVRPITDFRNHAAEILAQVRVTKRPVVITQKGKSAAVLMDAEHYEKQQELLELLQKLAKGIEAAEKGRLIPHAQVMREVEEWLGE